MPAAAHIKGQDDAAVAAEEARVVDEEHLVVEAGALAALEDMGVSAGVGVGVAGHSFVAMCWGLAGWCMDAVDGVEMLLVAQEL